jgi:tetratricopeptide (TPR) repeat protein
LAYSGTGNRQKAVDAFQHAAALDPHDARPLYHLGLLAASSPDARSQATDLLRSAIKLDPHNETYALALARILLEQDQAAEALRVIAQTKISSAESLTLEGIATISLRGVASAQPILQRAVVQNPDFALAQDLLGFCLYKQGNYAKAAEAYKVAADQEPSRLVYLHNTALAYYRANQIPQALNYAQRASSIPDTTADDHALLGKVYVAAGRQQEALPELQRAVELNPELESAYYTLARTYMRMGDRQQGTNWSEKLSALKQRHAASSATAVESDASSVRSSTLLSGNVISVDEESFP